LNKAERTFVIIDNTVKGLKYFGKIIAGDVNGNDNITLGDPNFYNKFNLNRRTYLGPTSTDNELAFLMSNLAKVDKDHYVYDPFVGTGSLLIPPSFFGCNVWGSDIDIRVLKGYGVGYTKKKKKEGNMDIFTNFVEYGLNMPNIIRCDINNPSMRNNEIFDTIICDPPYGHRAFTRKIALDEDIKIKSEIKKKRRELNKLKKESEEKEEIKGTENNNLTQIKENNGETKEFLNRIHDNKDNLLINLDLEAKENINEKRLDDDLLSSDSGENIDKNNGTGQYYIPLHQIEKEKIYENLLHMGKLCLRKGGLLVCLYPFKKTPE
jgi:tRNA G10  N-methylase Trm11